MNKIAQNIKIKKPNYINKIKYKILWINKYRILIALKTQKILNFKIILMKKTNKNKIK